MPRIDTNSRGEEETWYSVTETAQLVRAALKEKWPRVRFSVRSDKYAGGASIRVTYTDGPPTKAVEQVTDAFEGAHFDGMQDLKTYRKVIVNGKRVHYGADYIFVNREYSPAADALTGGGRSRR